MFHCDSDNINNEGSDIIRTFSNPGNGVSSTASMERPALTGNRETQNYGNSLVRSLGVATMEKRTLKNVNNCLNTNIYPSLETYGGQSLNLHLNVDHFFNTSVNRYLWQLKTVVFLHWCLICAVLLFKLQANIRLGWKWMVTSFQSSNFHYHYLKSYRACP
jgi:hypothetical protein